VPKRNVRRPGARQRRRPVAENFGGEVSRSVVFEAFFEALAAMSDTAHPVQMFDSTVVRAHVGRRHGGKNLRCFSCLSPFRWGSPRLWALLAIGMAHL
jgi:hypothetical protein